MAKGDELNKLKIQVSKLDKDNRELSQRNLYLVEELNRIINKDNSLKKAIAMVGNTTDFEVVKKLTMEIFDFMVEKETEDKVDENKKELI